MFGILRILFWTIILGICLLIMKKMEQYKTKNVIIISIVITSLCTLSGLIPIENCFITFETASQAYNYTNYEKVKLVVDGKFSSLVIGEKSEGNYVYSIFPKYEHGYKLDKKMNKKIKDQIYDKSVTITLYEYKNKDIIEYYISILYTNGTIVKIIDSSNSNYIKLDNSFENYSHYFANISNINEDYWVEINDKKYTFSNNELN